ncbi:MAG: nucleotide pyrophosphohydrolase [Heliobacteriaceae bacterium]|nr:nucleotide pyrophosphohydrolase [Heliobacteriaceae bacterium]MDD4588208.1 nucleotide pyrophosphohydrolase [Heliobacteriaceae bacterium]
MNSPTLNEVQTTVDQYINQFAEGYFDPPTLVNRFCEELGELAREVSHQYGPKKKKPDEPRGDLALELGDLFFVLVCFANSQGFNLGEIFQQTMAKYTTRDKDRWTRKRIDDSPPDV